MELAWAGPLMQTYDVPNGNPLLAGTVGQVASLRGTDPLPYASGVLRSWQLPELTPDPAEPTFWLGTSTAAPSIPSADDAKSWAKDAGLVVLFALIGLLILGAGLFAVVKD